MTPLLVFGLDGASLPLLRDYVRRRPGGAFSFLLNHGVAAPLRSTLPFFTAPAWATIASGLLPGCHGLFHWLGRYDPVLGKRPLLSSAHMTKATIWHHAQMEGLRVSVSNFPMEYPAPPVNGRYICGTLAPEDASNTTWPRILAARLRAAQPNFRFEMEKGLTFCDDKAALREHILAVGRLQAKALFDFTTPEKADFLFHVVTITDRMQHFFWDSDGGAAVIEAYAVAEATLNQLLSLRSWRNVVLVSDHGMGPSRVAFHADAWLRDEGYLTVRNGSIELSDSLAYSGQEPECSIYVQRRIRDGAGVTDDAYEALVEHIREKLARVRTPEGLLAFACSHRADLTHQGRFATQAPDIILEPAEGVHPRPGLAEHVFSQDTRLLAGHRRDGLFLAWGADIAFGAEPLTLGVEDIFPLLCALARLPIPAGLDGSLPETILARDMPPISRSVEDWSLRVAPVLSLQDNNENMMRRFRELGYIE